jgi:hypothetical protein
MGRVGPLLAVIVVLGLAVAPPTTAGTQADRTIEQTVTLSLTPERPGSIAVTVRYDVPPSVTSLTTTLPSNATVTRLDGFAADGDGFAWQGETREPSLSFRMPANRTGIARHGVEADGYTFVDVGDWALVRVPGIDAEWTWDGASNVTTNSTVEVAGEGATTGSIAYLGPHRSYERTVANQTIRLVVPATGSIEAGREAVLDVLAHAAATLAVGEADDEVVVVAAPQGVEWAADGAQLGDADAWIAADEPVADPDDVWTHEYVHTRQDYRLVPEMAWFAEASAEYYAAALALETGRVSYVEFRRHVTPHVGGAAGDDVLADPGTWTAATVYRKGATVLAAIDARIRAETGGHRSLVNVSRRLSRYDGTVTVQVFLDAVEAVAGPDVRRFAERAITDDGTPPLPPETAYDTAENESTGF